MTGLRTIVLKGGFELLLVLRTGRVAIYRQQPPGGNPDHDGYEVILPQVRNTNHKGEPVEPYEAFPSAESWGKKGWTFPNLDKAVQKLLQLTRKASAAGTVSRKNRLQARRSRRGAQLQRKPLGWHWRAAIQSGQSRHTRRATAGKRLVQTRQGFPPLSAVRPYSTNALGTPATIVPPDATESRRV
jgi:hypothetical protein